MGGTALHGDPLHQTLLWPGVVEVHGVAPQDTPHVALAEDEGVIQARRTLPREHLHVAFWRGARYAVRGAVMSLAAATRASASPYLRSFSLMRYRGRWSNGVASHSCRATQASVRWCVTPTCTTRRVPRATTQSAHTGRKRRSVTGWESHARMSAAGWRRNVAQGCPVQRVARAARRYRWIVELATGMSRLRRSPRMRAAPHGRLAAASSRIGATVSGASGGRCAGPGSPTPVAAEQQTTPAQERVRLRDQQHL